MPHNVAHPALRRQTLSDLLHRTAARLPHKPGIVCGSTRWTWKEFDTVVSRLAAGLICRRQLMVCKVDDRGAGAGKSFSHGSQITTRRRWCAPHG